MISLIENPALVEWVFFIYTYVHKKKFRFNRVKGLHFKLFQQKIFSFTA